MLLTPRILRGLLGMLIIVKNSVNNTTLVRLGCGIFTSKTSSIAPPSITVTICQVPFTQRLPLNNCWHPKLILAIFFGNSISRSRSVTDSAFPVLQDKLISTYLEKAGCVLPKVKWFGEQLKGFSAAWTTMLESCDQTDIAQWAYRSIIHQCQLSRGTYPKVGNAWSIAKKPSNTLNGLFLSEINY